MQGRARSNSPKRSGCRRPPARVGFVSSRKPVSFAAIGPTSNRLRLGLVTTVIVTITLEKQSEEYLAAFEAAIARCPDVVSCHLMSGSDDYHLQVIARDIADFERIHKQHLSRMPGVARIHSSFAMREVVRRAIPETALQR
jgi:DNA-binding Lrp family transcriptional regulator